MRNSRNTAAAIASPVASAFARVSLSRTETYTAPHHEHCGLISSRKVKSMDLNVTRQFVETTWTEKIIPALQEYLIIPNQSPAYDPNWNTNGYLDQATKLIANW